MMNDKLNDKLIWIMLFTLFGVMTLMSIFGIPIPDAFDKALIILALKILGIKVSKISID